MDQAQLLSIIGSVYDKFVADVSAKVESRLLDSIVDRLNTSGMLTTEIDTRIQAKIDDLTNLDTDMIRELARTEIENADLDEKIGDWMSNNFDLTDYEDHLDIDDRISDWMMSSKLNDSVRDAVRDLSFSVTVD